MYADSSSVRAAREQYFAANGFSEATYTADWVTLGRLGPIPIGFPNTESRKRAIPIHDLHHVATGYATTFAGESEIAAWEIAGGCSDYSAAWVLNACSFACGLVLAPRRVYRAFLRGRNSRTLYHTGWNDSLLDASVADLKTSLSIDRADAKTTWRDRFAFAGWALLVSSPALVVLAIAIALLG